jgi:hypothetical protein
MILRTCPYVGADGDSHGVVEESLRSNSKYITTPVSLKTDSPYIGARSKTNTPNFNLTLNPKINSKTSNNNPNQTKTKKSPTDNIA